MKRAGSRLACPPLDAWWWSCGQSAAIRCVSFQRAKPPNVRKNAVRKEYDFSHAKPVSQIPALARLQAAHGGKARITLRIDADIRDAYKARARACGGRYETMINDALREHTQGWTLAAVIEKAVKESLKTTAHHSNSRRSEEHTSELQ